MRGIRLSLALLVIVIVAIIAIEVMREPDRHDKIVDMPGAVDKPRVVEAQKTEKKADAERKADSKAETMGQEKAGDDEAESPMTEEEKLAEAEEKLVEEFENLTDNWTEPSTNGVSIANVEEFTAAFRKLPKSRRDESIHRAINLIPDENFMLLAGVLLDPRMDKETVETVFADAINRDDAVKKVVLKRILENEGHPCYKDAEWLAK